METDRPLAEAFVDALARRDFDAVEVLLDPAVRFRALTPGETVTTTTAREAAACFRRWFGDKTDMEILDRQVETVVDRLRVGYRARVKVKGVSHLIAQSLCGDIEGGRFAVLDLLCAGFRPEEVPSHGITHLFDAGDLGCASGLPAEFRTRIGLIPIGHVLEVVTGDAAAKEDLPSMARLLGHRVQAVEPGADGKVTIRVERIK